ncbi:MAG: M42 family metallopeptidase [Ruminococcaceae bacterium]|nr:M42 family metallopeptidase [Oscillospiraceae bacterium]
MLEILKKLTSLDGVSGMEKAVSDAVIAEIDGFCEWETDNLGNIIAFKKGKNRSAKKLMVDAHLDEVGLIITDILESGFLKFKVVGGINTESLLSRRVRINGNLFGVVSSKPIHLLKKDAASKLPDANGLYIDIGLSKKSEAEGIVSVGDRAVLLGDYYETEDKILSKALDDRIGCAILIELLKNDSEYDFYATFTVQEELGLRGARTAAFKVDPQSAIMLEGTTAADIADVAEESKVCVLGKGAAVSFMDRATVYDREYYNAALNSGIACQAKRAVTGGNNSGAVHLNREGVRSLAISVPCRYIHTAASVADKNDIKAAYELAVYMIDAICSGKL